MQYLVFAFNKNAGKKQQGIKVTYEEVKQMQYKENQV